MTKISETEISDNVQKLLNHWPELKNNDEIWAEICGTIAHALGLSLREALDSKLPQKEAQILGFINFRKDRQ